MSTIKANTLLHSDGSTTNPPAIPALDQRMAKAWISWNMQGTQAILSSYNISSITDISVGNTQIATTTAITQERVVTGLSKASGFVALLTKPTSTTDLGVFRCIHNNGTVSDFDYAALTVFGN